MDVIARIDQARRECNVLEHPFYQRWTRRRAERRGAGFLRRRVPPRRRRAGAGLRQRRRQGRSGPSRRPRAPRRRGAQPRRAVGCVRGRCRRRGCLRRVSPLGETDACTRAWTAGDDALEHLAVLYAIEASQPAIAKTKLEGLVERYGYTRRRPGGRVLRAARQARRRARAPGAGADRRVDERRRGAGASLRPTAWSSAQPPHCRAIGSCSTAWTLGSHRPSERDRRLGARELACRARSLEVLTDLRF